MINREDILNIANLSKLFIAEEDIEDLANEMESIVNFANEINKVSDSSEKFDNINDISNKLREDIVEESFDRELILKNACGGKDGFFYIQNRR